MDWRQLGSLDRYEANKITSEPALSAEDDGYRRSRSCKRLTSASWVVGWFVFCQTEVRSCPYAKERSVRPRYMHIQSRCSHVGSVPNPISISE